MNEFSDIEGFPRRNLDLSRQWYLFYSAKGVIEKQAVSQLVQIPWGHNLAIIAKCKSIEEAMYYVQNTKLNNWSRSAF